MSGPAITKLKKYNFEVLSLVTVKIISPKIILADDFGGIIAIKECKKPAVDWAVWIIPQFILPVYFRAKYQNELPINGQVGGLLTV